MICLLTLVSFAKGVGSETEVVEEQIKAGAAGIKTHEDWGATYAGIDNSLKVADKYDVSLRSTLTL